MLDVCARRLSQTYDRLVGNREKLLDGALACLYEKGYARTTARDIASAAGVSLAAIGYHFGTTGALLSEALFRAVQQWGEELERTLVNDADPSQPMESRRATLWQRVVASVQANPALWSVQFELVVAMQRVSPSWASASLRPSPQPAVNWPRCSRGSIRPLSHSGLSG